jgi:hypothetical protein
MGSETWIRAEAILLFYVFQTNYVKVSYVFFLDYYYT